MRKAGNVYKDRVTRKFIPGDRVVIGPGCHDTQFCGHVGVVLEVITPNSDRQGNRVSLDTPVNHACVYWFRDDELAKLDA